jgi:parallel beta-helix repeat protein
MRIRRIVAACLVAGLGWPVAAATPASAAVIVVSPGESIQAAVDAADPGDVVLVEAGVYREQVNIYEDNITLRGNNAILKPPRELQSNNCADGPGEPSREGICIFRLGEQGPEEINNVRVSGFSVLNFPGTGIIALFGNRITLENNITIDNGEYGIASFVSRRVTYRNNRAEGSHEAGLYLGDTTGGGNLIVGNRATRNGLTGFFVRDAFGGTVMGNTAVDNCSGFFFLDTGSGGPGNNRDWRVEENVASDNNNVCHAAGEEAPPMSGAGIVLYGTTMVFVEDNTVQDNASEAPSIASGGIVLRDADMFGGGQAHENYVRFNTARRNLPYDIDAAGGAGINIVKHNVCQRGNPPEACPQPPQTAG